MRLFINVNDSEMSLTGNMSLVSMEMYKYLEYIYVLNYRVLALDQDLQMNKYLHPKIDIYRSAWTANSTISYSFLFFSSH